MNRLGLILAATWLLAASVTRAGELDAEFVGQVKPVKAALAVVEKPSTELDAESPTQACCFKRWLCGYRTYGCVGYTYRKKCGLGGYRTGFSYASYSSFGYAGYSSFGYGGFW